MRRGPDGTLERRRNVFRPDLADARLKGVVEAERYVEGRAAVCVAPTAPYRDNPDPQEAYSASLIMGENVRVFEEQDGWAWVQSERDEYVGYVPASAVGDVGAAPTHRVRVARAHRYPRPEFKAPLGGWAPLGGALALTGRTAGRFAETADGDWVVADHLLEIGVQEADWTAVAQRLLGAPYLWGGETVEGVDCSGMVQIALEQAGIPCPRDSDMQERELGRALSAGAPLQRGDLVFWKGHVGLMLDAETLLHANAGAMLCAPENLKATIARVEAAGEGPPTAFKRLD